MTVAALGELQLQQLTKDGWVFSEKIIVQLIKNNVFHVRPVSKEHIDPEGHYRIVRSVKVGKKTEITPQVGQVQFIE